MSHQHDHEPQNYNRAFAIGVILNVIFVAVEAVYGILADSLALLADAGHNLSDILGLLLAWGASLLAGRKPTPRRTYGFRRATILASLFSAILLLVALGGIVWEAIGRIREPAAANGLTIIVVAGIGVVINTATALMFLSGRKRDLNIKGAFLHMAADAGVSLGVVVAGLVIMFTAWSWIDPAISLTIAAIILIGTWGLLRDSLNLSLDTVPRGIDPTQVKDYLGGLPGVNGCHDLHIWGMSTTETALTVHLVMPQITPDDGFLSQVTGDLHHRFGIEHSTIQVEQASSAELCGQAGEDSI